MSRKALWIHVALCAAALGFAWRMHTRVEQKKGGPSSVTLLDVAAGDIEEVRYSWDKGATVVKSAGAGEDRVAVAEVDRELPAPKKDPKKDPKEDPKQDPKEGDQKEKADVAAATAPESPPARETGRGPAGKPVHTALEALEPLRSKRTLGEVEADRLPAMGLDKPLRVLDVKTRSGKSLKLEIGEQSYGAQGRYARVAGDKVVHLIDAAIVSGLEGGVDQLLEKRLLTAPLEKIRAYEVTRAGGRASFLHMERDQTSKRYFARTDDPQKKVEAAAKLMTTLRNLRATRLASTEAAASAGELAASFAVDVGGTSRVIEVVQRGDQDGHLLRAGTWVFDMTATQDKELFEDIDAALAE